MIRLGGLSVNLPPPFRSVARVSGGFWLVRFCSPFDWVGEASFGGPFVCGVRIRSEQTAMDYELSDSSGMYDKDRRFDFFCAS